MSDRDVDALVTAGEISLGRELRRAREVRGISLEQIAVETKIGERYLQALEADRLDLLPGALYARNFVRQYARFIGADEEELLDYFSYQQRLHDEAVAQGEKRAGDSARRRVLALAGLAVAALVIIMVIVMSVSRGGDDAGATPAPAKPPSATVAAKPEATQAAPAPALPVLVAAESRGSASAAAPPAVPPAADGATGASGNVVPPAAPAVSATPPAAADAASAADGCAEAPVARLVFNEESWVEVRRAGDAEPFYGLQAKGSVLTYSLDQPVTILVSNAGGVALYVADQQAKALGAPRESRKLSLDCRNYRSYL